ncbi:unnamed protein product [Lupinus luteus]|uniref:R13L1/DRL21-like LRR repeat region domain-containing protein n=1 Tax=Lupinus luteus TaxID=3873 RepID=A0AAV1WRQ8_LUPLU
MSPLFFSGNIFRESQRFNQTPDITTLPESLSSLIKLQILKLERCYSLDRLTQHLTHLKDLRHVIIKRCTKLVAISPNIGKLKCLKRLSIFIVDLKSGFGLEELHDLQLGGNLQIRGLENIKTGLDARQANFVGKKILNHVCFSLKRRNDNPDDTHAESVLKIPSRLLAVKYYLVEM